MKNGDDKVHLKPCVGVEVGDNIFIENELFRIDAISQQVREFQLMRCSPICS